MDWRIHLIILIVIIAIMFALAIDSKDRTTRVGGGTTSELIQEFENWSRTIRRIAIATVGLDVRAAYEMRNILERWALSRTNTLDAPDAKMRAEIIEKRIMRPGAQLDALIARIADQSRVPVVLPENATVSIIGSTISFGPWSKVIAPARIALLRKFAAPEQIAVMAMRYDTLVQGSQQWAIPAAVYDVLVREYGADIEAFASPLNSQILVHRAREIEEKGTSTRRFCSLFPDTDAIFGSLGDFFSADIAGHTVVINPPFIVKLIDRIVARCANLPFEKTRLFIVAPSWADAEFYQKLSAHPALVGKIEHRKYETYYEEGEKQIVASFETTMFVLGDANAIAGDRTISLDELRRASAVPAHLRRA